MEALLQAGADPSDVYELLDKSTLQRINRARNAPREILIPAIVHSPQCEEVSPGSSNSNFDEAWDDHYTLVIQPLPPASVDLPLSAADMCRSQGDDFHDDQVTTPGSVKYRSKSDESRTIDYENDLSTATSLRSSSKTPNPDAHGTAHALLWCRRLVPYSDGLRAYLHKVVKRTPISPKSV